LNGKTYLVPVEIADKVVALNPDWAVSRPGSNSAESGDHDDAYDDYRVPDDLNW
jgi:uncharacterized protein YaiL (DUF2058 family)